MSFSSSKKTNKKEILLDTNALLWYLNGDERMSDKAANEIYESIHSESIFISIASFWEILCFSDTKMKLFKSNITRQLLISKIKEIFKPKVINIDEKILFKAYELRMFHPDPADRFLVATAIVNKIPLYTSDELIIKWQMKNRDEFALYKTRKNS